MNELRYIIFSKILYKVRERIHNAIYLGSFCPLYFGCICILLGRYLETSRFVFTGMAENKRQGSNRSCAH